MWGRHNSCGLVDRTPTHAPLDQPSRQPASDPVDTVSEGTQAVAQAVVDIAGTAEDLIGEAVGEISEADLVGAILQMLSILHIMQLVAFGLA